jgi:transaldolase
MNKLDDLKAAGVSVWLDALSREMLDDGDFARYQRELTITGATSNPTIFVKAICGSERYDEQLHELLSRGVEDPGELFLELALEDVRRAAASLSPVFAETAGVDGYVSFECTPDVASDAAATVAQALDFWERLDAPNVMIKVPATEQGVDAIEQLTALGINVNVTLLFAVERYEQVIEAFLRGLESRADRGDPLTSVRSVASFFVSRVDAKADALLPPGSPLRGRVAIANALVAFARFRHAFSGPRWDRLERLGARPQSPLWASTATKSPAYRDVVYLERLALPGSIATVPKATLSAFADHGRPDPEALASVALASDELARAAEAIDLARVTRDLEREGVDAFGASYRELQACIEERVTALRAGRAAVANQRG